MWSIRRYHPDPSIFYLSTVKLRVVFVQKNEIPPPPPHLMIASKCVPILSSITVPHCCLYRMSPWWNWIQISQFSVPIKSSLKKFVLIRDQTYFVPIRFEMCSLIQWYKSASRFLSFFTACLSSFLHSQFDSVDSFHRQLLQLQGNLKMIPIYFQN